jgi:hypothetical protein
MESGKIVYSLLSADSNVTNITPRIYGNEARQGVDLPCVVYSIISNVPFNSKSGIRAYQSRVQCSCYSESYEGAQTLAIAVRNSLADKPMGTYGGIFCQGISFDGSQDFRDDAGQEGYYHVTCDFLIYFNG